jgi:parvulin-like peptidyl-prolyl isomerase
VIARAFQVSDFDPAIGARISALAPGQVADPFQDMSRFVIIKRMPPDSTTPPTGLRIAQIVVRVRSSDSEIRAQSDKLKKMRADAKRMGLGKVAAAAGLATSTTGPYDVNNTPQQLYPVPEAADWGLNAKVHDVSPVFEGPDEFAIVQVIRQSPAGVASRTEIEQPLHQLAELEARVQQAKPKADAIAQALHQGRSLEDAAAAAGLQPVKLTGITRVSPDPRIANAPEVIGALFGAKPGQVVGPIETVGGWFIVRVDQTTPADMAAFAAQKSQLMSELLEKRQRAFLGSYLSELRQKSKVQDLRAEAAQ